MGRIRSGRISVFRSVASEKQLAGMQQRIDDIMLGLAQVNYDNYDAVGPSLVLADQDHKRRDTKGQHSCIVKFNN